MSRSIELTEQLIKLVQERPSLWNSSDKRYHNVVLKHHDWTEIAAAIQLDVNQCKQFWRSVRDRYTKQRKSETNPTGHKPLSKYKKYYLGPQLRFLDDSIQIREKKTGGGGDIGGIEAQEELDLDHLLLLNNQNYECDMPSPYYCQGGECGSSVFEHYTDLEAHIAFLHCQYTPFACSKCNCSLPTAHRFHEHCALVHGPESEWPVALFTMHSAKHTQMQHLLQRTLKATERRQGIKSEAIDYDQLRDLLAPSSSSTPFSQIETSVSNLPQVADTSYSNVNAYLNGTPAIEDNTIQSINNEHANQSIQINRCVPLDNINMFSAVQEPLGLSPSIPIAGSSSHHKHNLLNEDSQFVAQLQFPHDSDASQKQQCGICGKSIDVDKMESHMGVHSLDRRFPCGHCTMRFNSNALLNNHMRQVHSSIRPYHCKICGATAKTMGNLRVHQMTHTEKQFPCPDCGRKFLRRDAVKRHMKFNSCRKIT